MRRMMVVVAIVAVVLTLDKVICDFLIKAHNSDASWLGTMFILLCMNVFVVMFIWVWRFARYD